MKRVVSTLDKIEKDLSAYEEERKRYNDAAVERMSASLGKALQRLEAMPPAEEGASEERSRADDFEERIRALVAERGSLGAKSGLDSKTCAKINGFDTKLMNLANELAKHGPEGKFGMNERTQERLGKKVSGLVVDLGVLPADNPIVAGLLTRSAELQAGFERLSASFAEAQGAAADEAARVAALEADSSYEGDLERVKHFLVMFKEGRRFFALDALHFRRIGGVEDESKDLARSWEEHRRVYRELRERYDLLVTHGPGRTAMKWALKEGDEWFPRYTELVESFQREARGAVEGAADEARSLASAAVAAQNHRPFSYEQSDLRSRARYAQNVAELHDLFEAPSDSLTPTFCALEADLAREEEQLADLIVAENRAPEDVFTGSDRSEVEAFVLAEWAKHFPAEEVLGLRFSQQAFARTTAWRMESGQSQLTKVDHSDLWLHVIVGAGEEALLYRVLVTRLHLQGEGLALRWSRPDPVPPGGRMLRANL